MLWLAFVMHDTWRARVLIDDLFSYGYGLSNSPIQVHQADLAGDLVDLYV